MILWADGFDQYGVDADILNGAWTNVSSGVRLNTAMGATGPKSLSVSSIATAVSRYMGGDYTNYSAGLHLYPRSLPTRAANGVCFMFFRSEFETQENGQNPRTYGLGLAPSGRIQLLNLTQIVANRPVPIATSKKAVPAGSWSHVEMVVNNTENSIKVYLNGKEVISAPSPLAGRLVSLFSVGMPTSLGGGGQDSYIDDVIVSGSNDGPLAPVGIMSVYYQRPIIDQDPQDFQLTSGTEAFALVDELAPDYDAQYIYSDMAGNEVQFGVEPLPLGVVEVRGVIPLTFTRKSDVGICDYAVGITTEGGSTYGEDEAATTDYTWGWTVFEKDPVTQEPFHPTQLPSIIAARTL